MKITCPACQIEIRAEDVDLVQKIAKCTHCNQIFSCADQLASLSSDLTDNKPQPQKPEVALPSQMRVSQLDRGFQLAVKWFSAKFLFLTFFCIIWDGFMVVWFSIAFSQGALIMAAFGSLHALVGIGLTYFTIAGYLNWTVINVDREQVMVKIGPLPWFGNKNIATASIEQLYCKDKITRGKNGTTTVTYEVHLETREGSSMKLVTGLTAENQAFYIEQEIEKYLGIRDRPVRGELHA